MKRSLSLFLFFALFGTILSAQDKEEPEFDLTNIYASGDFFPQTFSSLNHFKDGKSYSRLENKDNEYFIVRYNYRDNKAQDTLFNSNWLKENERIGVEAYKLSKSGNKIVLRGQTIPIYRHSKKAKWYVFDATDKTLTSLKDEAFVMYASLSPDENRVAYVFQNNLYIQNLDNGEVIEVTSDGEDDKIINGASDWVYEEEFKLVKAFEWSPDGENIAYYRFDESAVREYQIPYYQGVYPDQYVYKYPKVGETNSEISLYVYNIKSESGQIVDLMGKGDIYVPRMKWTNDPNLLSFQKMNRHQNKLELIFWDVEKEKSKLVYKEENKDAYIDIDDDLSFLGNNDFLWSSDRDGYNHLYLISKKGRIKKQVTSGNWELTNFYGIDDKERVYYQSTEESPLERHVYSVKLNGKGKKKLSSEEGNNSAQFSANYEFYILNHHSANKPHTYTLHHQKDGKLKTLIENPALEERMEKYNFSKKTFFKIPVHDTLELNAWMIKPPNFDADKEYPLFITIYGGPGSQTVMDEWGWVNYLYYQMLAMKGYIVVSVDNRGTGGRGAHFKKMTYLNLGKYESEDQIAAAKYLGNLNYIDADKICIFGWSFGGYLSSLSLLKGNDVFKGAVSVAPVTDWRFYDNIYTERYMRTPDENKKGYKESSVLNYVDQLDGKLLLIHGTYDDNVHPHNSMAYIEALIQSRKKFDSEFYPNKAHSISGPLTRIHLFERITEFLEEEIK